MRAQALPEARRFLSDESSQTLQWLTLASAPRIVSALTQAPHFARPVQSCLAQKQGNQIHRIRANIGPVHSRMNPPRPVPACMISQSVLVAVSSLLIVLPDECPQAIARNSKCDKPSTFLASLIHCPVVLEN